MRAFCQAVLTPKTFPGNCKVRNPSCNRSTLHQDLLKVFRSGVLMEMIAPSTLCRCILRSSGMLCLQGWIVQKRVVLAATNFDEPTRGAVNGNRLGTSICKATSCGLPKLVQSPLPGWDFLACAGEACAATTIQKSGRAGQRTQAYCKMTRRPRAQVASFISPGSERDKPMPRRP